MDRALLRSPLLVALLFGCARVQSLPVERDPSSGSGSPIADFALLDEEGRFFLLGEQSDVDLVVFYAHAIGCPIVAQTVPDLEALQAESSSNRARFFLINSTAADTPAEIRAEKKRMGFSTPVLIDDTQDVARALGLTRTAEAVVVRARDLSIVWRGPIDDRVGYQKRSVEASERYLAHALSDLLAGRRPDTDHPPAKGCAITFALRPLVDYGRDVAPLIAAKCSGCHRPSGVGPFSLDRYASVAKWSAMMREVVMTRRMPPFQPDPEYPGIDGSQALDRDQRRALIAWLDSRSPAAPLTDPLPELVERSEPAPSDLGVPDVVLDFGRTSLPSAGPDRWVNVGPKGFWWDDHPNNRLLDLVLSGSEDVWVRALEFRPSNRRSLHHVVAWPAPPGRRIEGYRDIDGKHRVLPMLFNYNPGRAFVSDLGAGIGKLVKKGERIGASLHYVTIGEPTDNALSIAIYFHKKKPRNAARIDCYDKSTIDIPPFERDHEERLEHVFVDDTVIVGLYPHMHFRGHRMRFDLVLPDGTERTLLSVPHYSQSWQLEYPLVEPLRVPRGSKLVVTGGYDNSRFNENNPDPSARVSWGEATTQEMLMPCVIISEAVTP